MFFKKTMLWVIMISILISISSNSWFVYWLTMEMNLMSFIPIMNNYKMKNCDSMIIYFIIQSFSSSLFFISSFQFDLNNSSLALIIINMSILIKLAIMPFHFWLISMSESLSFNVLFIILSIQKIIPLFIFSKFFTQMIIIIVMFSTMLSSVMALNLKIIKKLLIFSSISHQGWMMCLIFKKINFWISYLIMYMYIIFSVINMCKKHKMNSFFNNTINKMNYNEKMNFISQFMSLGGMPPFLGFFMKIMAIFLLMKMNFWLMMILICSSLVNLFFYLKIMTPFLFLFKKNLSINKISFNKSFLMNINIMTLIFIVNLLIF
uniref:NADH-ubiquinone oxidoreductase chain 2 n=1 Tax=Dermacentor auratus TaxID=1256036 RepID=A0A8A2H854_9ACAR|nr:NADH dehydrogenase subunit 2 [Dermacentor auratus]QSV37408.1 NADH dehydrogenase subunit 2 [Dermacentor auratus]